MKNFSRNSLKRRLSKMRRDGFDVSINTPLDDGPILHVVGIKQAANALSDLPTLAKYSQVALRPSFGDLTVYIGVPKLLDSPQVIIGFERWGFPILLGATRALEGHLTVLGQTRSGKTQIVALIIYQLCRLGLVTIIIGGKSIDNLLVASAKAGCESRTRVDKSTGNLVSARFEYCTLQPGAKTKAFNPFVQQGSPHTQPVFDAANMVRAVIAGNPASNPAVRFFAGSAVEMLLQTKQPGSARDLSTQLKKLKQNRDEQYSTAGVRNEIAQLGTIDQINRPISDPLSIDVASAIKEGSSVYIDCNAQDAGTISTSFSGIAVQSIIKTKRAVAPSRTERVFIIIDEAQIFPRDYLKQLIEQASSAGITLILIYHTLDQMGEDAETISMTQARIILGAVPGGSTDRHLQNLFGTHKVYRRNFSLGTGGNTALSFSESSGNSGTSVTRGISNSKSQQSSFGFTEDEEDVWKANDTLALNDDREQFVCMVSPGADLAHWGGAIVGIRDDMHLSFDEINQIAEEVLLNSTDTYLPGAGAILPGVVPPSSRVALTHDPKRDFWINLFAKVIQQIRQKRT